MSKASEWAKTQPPHCMFEDRAIATVDERGYAQVQGFDAQGNSVTVTLTQKPALVLGAWLLDTFGEK